MSDQTVWMTTAALAALEDELRDLEAHGAEADTARLIEVRDLVRRAETTTKPDDGLVEPGMTVTVRFVGDESTETFLLGSRELLRQDHDPDLSVSSPESPLGAAVTGHRVGETVSYRGPSGRSLEVEIVAATPFA